MQSTTPSLPSPRWHERLIVLLAVPLQLLTLYLVPLVYECDAAVYYHYAVASTYRPPLFAALLWLTGQHLLDTFAITLAAHAAMGVGSALLVYRTLAPLTPRGALAVAIVYAVSLVPFTAAKLMLAEQLFTIEVLATCYFLSRYWFTAERRFIALTFVAGLCAMFTRWEGEFLLGVCALVLLGWAYSRGADHMRRWVVCVLATGMICGGWSLYRAVVIHDMRLFGTMQNGTGDQLFWHVYIYMGPELYLWERLMDPAIDAQRRLEPPDAAANYRLVRIENGPATRDLADTIRRIARKRSAEDEIFGAQLVEPGKGGFVKRLSGDPERLVREIFESPNQTYVFSVPSEIRRELGPRDGERLLLATSIEAIRRHPTFFVSKLSVALTMVGVSVDAGYFERGLEYRRHGGTPAEGRYRDLSTTLPIMKLWSDIHYADVPFNLGNCAVGSLPSRMVAEYKWDRGLPRSAEWFTDIISAGRNTLRNVVGPLFLLSLLLLPFAPARMFFIGTAVAVLTNIGLVAALGGGAYTRYEYAVLPLLLIVTAGGGLAAARLLRPGVQVRATTAAAVVTRDG